MLGVFANQTFRFFLVQVVDEMVEHCRRSRNHAFNSWDLWEGGKKHKHKQLCCQCSEIRQLLHRHLALAGACTNLFALT